MEITSAWKARYFILFSNQSKAVISISILSVLEKNAILWINLSSKNIHPSVRMHHTLLKTNSGSWGLNWNDSEYTHVIAIISISSGKFSCSVVSHSLWPHGLQHARIPCPPPTPRAYSNSCASRRWCHPTISSSFVLFSSCQPQGFFQWVSSSYQVDKVLAF